MKNNILACLALLMLIGLAACVVSNAATASTASATNSGRGTGAVTADPSPVILETQLRTVTPPGDKVSVTDTVEPQRMPTETPLPPNVVLQPTLASLIYKEYDPTEWQLIPGSEDDLAYSSVFLDPNHWLWMLDSRGDQQNLIYYDGKDWGKVSLNELHYEDIFYIQCINPDGTLWLSGKQREKGESYLIRYKDKEMISFSIPNATDRDLIVFTADHHQGVWALINEREQKPKHLYHFDGLNWQEYPLPFGKRLIGSSDLETDAQGDLWLIAHGVGFARFDGKTWSEYEASDYWLKDNIYSQTIWLAPGPDGSVWAVMGYSAELSTIYRFYPDGRIDKIKAPFLGKHFGLGMWLYVDNQNLLWLREGAATDPVPPLIYWDGNNWNTFTGLPFKHIGTLVPQGNRLFIQTETGWYWYTPAR